MVNRACFFMLCTNRTEQECIEKGLFGDLDYRISHIQSIKEGDIGFLINVSENKIIGTFVAESKASLDIDPDAWGGKFRAQVKVKKVGELKYIAQASDKLGKIIKLRFMGGRKYPYYIPEKNTYGPEITEKVLSFFQIDDNQIIYFTKTEQEKTQDFSEYKINEVAGLKDVKKFIHQRIISPFEDEETAFRLGIRVGGGLLLFGPPGTGKTLISMTIAENIESKFIYISPSVIVGYPGDAEKRIENIFYSLEKEPRAVIFLDEAEWILCKREEQTSSVMQRITPVVLAQLSRIFKQKRKPVIVIAATNKPTIIDSAFLRPGRFDRIFYVGLPDYEARREIIKICCKNRDHALSNNDIDDIATKLNGYSGADIDYIIEQAAFHAFEHRKQILPKITKDLIVSVLESTPKSVTENEIKLIEEWARKRGIKI